MSKGIIVVDKILRNCRNIRGDTENECPYGGMECQITHKDVMKRVEDGTKPDWCPIRTVPERKSSSQYPLSPLFELTYTDYEKGWNVCINTILEDGDTNVQEP